MLDSDDRDEGFLGRFLEQIEDRYGAAASAAVEDALIGRPELAGELEASLDHDEARVDALLGRILRARATRH